MIVPDWPAPTNVHARCSTRSGGRSLPPYDSLNLGDHVGDDAQHVAANRLAFATALGARPVFLKQVHGMHPCELRAETTDGIEADGSVTTQRGLACTIMAADCLPVLFCDAQGTAVAAAHAGWRGLAGEGGTGILEAVLEHFWRLTGTGHKHVAATTMAWLGPCIGPAAFEVGMEVKVAFEAHDPDAGHCFMKRGDGKWLADLQALARRRMRAMGIRQIHGNDGSLEWCTARNPLNFFSHRRDRVAGRFAASVWLG